MRKVLLPMIIMGVSFLTAVGQAPRLWLNAGEFYTEMAAGEIDSQLVIIRNTGNRDLNWSFTDVYGNSVDFTKADYADWTLAENQDRITGAVWITRANERGIFNIAREEEFDWMSPVNTEWAPGNTLGVDPGDYTNWGNAVGWNPPNMVGKTYSMFLPEYSQFYDVVFHRWTQGAGGEGQGGGFSYTRTEIPRWISASKMSNTLIPGGSDTVWVYFDAGNLVQRNYVAYAEMTTNDPLTPLAVITFNLNISSGNPEIYIEETSIAFNDVFVNYPETYQLNIINEGSGDLEITGVAFNLPEFSSPTTSLTVPPLDFRSVDVVFTPLLKKEYSDTIYLSSNDTDDPLIKIPLTGTGIAPADIQVDPLSFVETVPQGNIVALKLVISNTDSTDLEWGIDVMADMVKTGNEVTFTKADYSDWNLPSNQDIWSPNVTITRANSQGIFNIANEASYQWGSPSLTLWSFGNTGELEQDDYEIWVDAVMGNPPSMVDNPMSVYLPEDDIYYDILFHSWSGGGSGGGFSYTRQLFTKWLGISEASGTTSITEPDTVTVLIDATGLVNGTYSGSLAIYSNDPDEGEINIPVQITVAGGVQNISVSEPLLDFGDVFAGDSKILALEIENDGTGDLTVSGITTISDKFEVAPSSFTLNGNSKQTVDIEFSPESAESVVDTLYITSDDPETPLVKIPIVANVILPPGIEVPTQDISVDIMSDDIFVYKLPVKNTGDNDLEYEIVRKQQVVFSKEDYADFTLPENQDRITDNVWITRASTQGLFNAATENSFNSTISPDGTEWAYGATEDVDPGDYEVWVNAIGWYPPGMVGNVLSLHLIEEDLYYDVEFTSWTQGGNGGGFSYIRAEQMPDWLDVVNKSGTVAPGETDTVELVFDSEGLNEQAYQITFLMNTNVPGSKSILFNVTMNVQGVPDISISANDLDFGTTYIGFPDTLQVIVTNTGTDSLVLDNLTTQTGYFSPVEDQLLVMPGEDRPLRMVFNPDALQEYLDTVEFSTNVTGVPSMSVSLKGMGANPPNLSVEPEMLSYVTYYDKIITDSVFLLNSGSGPALWNANLIDRNIGLDDVLENLNTNSAGIISQIPNMYTFSYDGDDYSIGDGGNDMYDGGNYLSTSMGMSNIMYSDNIIVSGDMHFGANTAYFTRHLDGLFVLAADMNEVESFHIDGDLGADGGGSYNSAVLEYEYNGIRFKGFVKRVYNAGDPSVNHLVIIEENPNATQSIGTTTNSDMHYLEGLSGTQRMYYLLYAGASGYYIDDPGTMAIMEAFIESVYMAPEWIKLTFTNDAIASSSTDTIGITINTTGMMSGDYNGRIFIPCNNPVNRMLEVPVSLTVKGIAVVNPLEDMLVNEGFVSDTIDISGVFEDAEGDALEYTITSSEPEVVTVDTTEGKLLVMEAGTGTSTITIRAADGFGNVEYEDFQYRVNANPTLLTPIADYTVNEGFAADTIDLSAVFADVDNDPLKFSFTNSNPATVDVSVMENMLLIGEVAYGNSNISVTASDSVGIPATDEFVITVNSLPVVAGAINDTTVNEGFASYTVDLLAVFNDADNETLAYELTNSNPAAVTVSLAGDVLTVQEVAYGISTISVSATDNIGTPASDEFVVTVNALPVLAKAINDTTVNEGFASYTVDLSAVFNDADNETLAYELTNSNPATVTVSVTGDVLTVQEVAYGSSTISVSASDNIGAPAGDEFVVTVNAIPVVASALSDIKMDEGFVTHTVDLGSVFADNDDTQLELSATSDNTAVVTVSVDAATLTVTEAGVGTANITVTATDSKGADASDVFEFTVEDVTALESLTDAGVSLYPNPTKGKIYLSVENADHMLITVEFTNITGDVMMNDRFRCSGIARELDLTSFSKGMYFMKITSDDCSVVKKIIIE
ncbi:MAG: choice-of-anchor D domain-containing protein [Bacteroidales bacterium]|nr:choice-of-anchor D domain-containing protein [Bacteroidales bacterium]